MKFSDLLQNAEASRNGNDLEITGLDYDSRRIRPGWAFVALRGETTDGNRYIDTALSNGAIAVVSDSSREPQRQGIAWATVPHGRKALAQLSANFYDCPAKKISVTGVTGTNGKTTTTFLIESILNFCDRQTTLLGTIEYHVAGRVIPAPHTTPEALELNQIFSQAVAAGASEGVMEVSSHALEQGRVYGIPYDVAVFTNLTRDHLDYHKDMESYFASKRLLFVGSGVHPPRAAAINVDDDYGRTLLSTSKKLSKQAISYGIDQADFCATNIRLYANESSFDLTAFGERIQVCTALIGRVNVYNLLAAAAACWARGCSLPQIAEAIGRFQRVPGRFEKVDCGQPFTVVVDYAHTDDALRNLTSIARDLAVRSESQGRVITVFGCGGDRDRAKRPLMGAAAGKGSDFVLLTSDNPRSEDPLKIMQDALPGLQQAGARYSLEPDRKKAIGAALAEARPGDVVLIAGKGHEKVQATREGTFPFDDVQVAREALQRLGHRDGAGGNQ
ncbi:MAG TPA: UDP-N-acetylmuramoyl-L-alanyl-D-glutamate--2,6-diaminopimelate ligase [Candidatus Angelobacter sp.]|nr:UDP-N-acetylmuramoyl-L-alanyl-D-glutamate--2,6-diaminopimelate ligase [Candidatus Angelobacter sp.]